MWPQCKVADFYFFPMPFPQCWLCERLQNGNSQPHPELCWAFQVPEAEIEVWSVVLSSLKAASKILKIRVFFFFFLWYWGLNSGPTLWATPPALFCEGSQIVILLISASCIARIRSASPWQLAWAIFEEGTPQNVLLWVFNVFPGTGVF
jgi:hypothetical protein